MTIDEYKAFYLALLKFKGIYVAGPSGWEQDALFYGPATSPIRVPFPEALTAEQRKTIVEKASAKYGFQYP